MRSRKAYRSIKKTKKKSRSRRIIKRSKKQNIFWKVKPRGGISFTQDTQNDDEMYRKLSFSQASTNVSQAAYLANTNSVMQNY